MSVMPAAITDQAEFPLPAKPAATLRDRAASHVAGNLLEPGQELFQVKVESIVDLLDGRVQVRVEYTYWPAAETEDATARAEE